MKPQASVNYAELTLGQGWQPSWWPSTWNGKAVKEESRDGSSLITLERKAFSSPGGLAGVDAHYKRSQYIYDS